jgi:hypothetical protein
MPLPERAGLLLGDIALVIEAFLPLGVLEWLRARAE